MFEQRFHERQAIPNLYPASGNHWRKNTRFTTSNASRKLHSHAASLSECRNAYSLRPTADRSHERTHANWFGRFKADALTLTKTTDWLYMKRGCRYLLTIRLEVCFNYSSILSPETCSSVMSADCMTLHLTRLRSSHQELYNNTHRHFTRK